MAGLRPVAEIMYMDFITVCLDPIVNQAAKLRYMTGGAATVPIVFRTQTGGGRSGGAQHSQSLEAMLAHVPGLRVYCPADARDAYDLLSRRCATTRPSASSRTGACTRGGTRTGSATPLPPGRARVVRPGGELTVVSWGRMVSETVRALEAAEGVDVELIDLRTLAPLDLDPVVRERREDRAAA